MPYKQNSFVNLFKWRGGQTAAQSQIMDNNSVDLDGTVAQAVEQQAAVVAEHIRLFEEKVKANGKKPNFVFISVEKRK